MAYEIENIRVSQNIFYELLSNGKISEHDNSTLFKMYVENDEVLNLVKSQAEIADCMIERFGNTIYIMPNMTNNILGYTKTELKKLLCSSKGLNRDYYLSQFIILTVIVEFYDGQGGHCKSREFIKMGELQNIVAQRLQEGVRIENENEENGVGELYDSGLDFHSMSQAFDALKSDEKSRSLTTKEGVLAAILSFLEKQELIVFIKEDEMIKTTERLDHLMEMKLLNKGNYTQVMNALGVNADE